MFKANIGKTPMPTPSPTGRWLGGTLTDVELGCLTWQCVVRDEMTNPAGVLHGGMISTMLDDIIGATVFSLGVDYFFTSINLNVDFLSSARRGDVVTVKTHVVRQGENVIHITADLTREDKLLAKASSNMIKTKVKVNF